MSLKTLVIGAHGTMGVDVCRLFTECGDEVLGPSRAELDACDPAQVRQAMEQFQPARVLHLAALTDVDRCQREPDAAFLNNTLATQNVALA